MPASSPTFQKSFVEKILGEAVKQFAVSDGSNAGDNFMGNITAITVVMENGQEINVVYKTMPKENSPVFEFAVKARVFWVENAFYQHAAPQIRAMLETKNCATKTLPIPKYYSGMNDDKNDYVVLEDLRPSGYVMPDKFLGLNLPETLLAMKTMARLHAVTYCLIREQGECIFERDGMDTLKDSYLRKEGSEFEHTGMVMIKANVQNTIALLEEGKHVAAAEKLRDLLNDELYLQKLTKAVYQSTDKVYFPCLVHGDLWLNNMLYKYEGGDREKPCDLQLIDFQQTHRGNIYEDLGYFLLTSTMAEFRSEHLPRVLFTYYEAFVAELDALECPIPSNFTRGVFIDHFYNNLLAFYVIMSFAIPMQLCEPGDMPFMDGSNGPSASDAPPNFSFPPGWKVEFMTPDDVAMVMQAQYLLQQMRKSPRALKRLVHLTYEMMSLNVL